MSKETTTCKIGAEPVEDSPLDASYRQRSLFALMVIFGFVVGIIAFVYDYCMEFSLEMFWEVIPDSIIEWGEEKGKMDLINRWGFLYTIAVATVLGAGAGLSIKHLGFPGDLPNVIKCVHKIGYVPMEQTLSMFATSLCSIAAGGSLGPEAPLVAISASVCGWLSMNYFKHDMVMVRKCTIIGMGAGLSAFFGVQFGGALFALEVLHTNGAQFYDVSVYTIGAGGMCLVVYRGLQGATFGEIWHFPDAPLSSASEVMLGALVGLVAGYTGIAFRSFFKGVGKVVHNLGLGHFEDTPKPVILATLGGLVIGIIGALVPPSMFWAEFEIGSIADEKVPLPHVWPPGGAFYGLEEYPWHTAPMYLLVGLAKLVAIAVTVQAGFRGGFIFPLFFAGASLGRALFVVSRFLPDSWVHDSPALMCMCFAAGLNVAITRTPFASPLILATLSGQPNITAPAVSAALASLFVTRLHQFIKAQEDRQDVMFVHDLQTPEELARERGQFPAGSPAPGGFAPAEVNSTLSKASATISPDAASAGSTDTAGAETRSLLVGEGPVASYGAAKAKAEETTSLLMEEYPVEEQKASAEDSV